MKFRFSEIPHRKIRRGRISDIPRLPGVTLETPLLLLNTKGGSIPHITHEVFQFLTREQHGIQISLPSSVHCFEGVKDFEKGISNFVGLQECVSYCSVQDPSTNTPEGYNGKNSISIWSNSGRMSLDANRYMDLMEAFRPDMYQALCHGDTNINSKKKKIKKAVDITAFLLDECLARHNKSEVLQSSAIFGVVEGGYDLDARRLSAKLLAERKVDGFVIDGLHNNGSSLDSINIDNVRPVIEETLKSLPEDKLRIIHGSWKPNYVLDLVEMGIDVFDSSLAEIVTERNSALVFRYELVPIDSIDRPGLERFEISLQDESFKEDFGPILEGCTCLTCRKHTKAYIYHLISNKELLASVLIMMHNLHHYIEFFKKIRSIPENKKLEII
ncbi:queuine tRNA-ribosyltransferase accessory subunit 2 [Rhodnius prolixus]|uniref:Queuine tRNA-ribosyltransferase accessory subunit 2 n=1 Tax=Rhodnius prolixus TaxID=13249 RepID=T1HU78_RHOPR